MRPAGLTELPVFAAFIALVAGAGLLAACATAPVADGPSSRTPSAETARASRRPRVEPPQTPAPHERSANESSSTAEGSAVISGREPSERDLPAASLSGSVAETPAPSASTSAPRLAWVNPARCLSSCAASPGASLVRVNDDAVPDRRGHHQVDAGALTALRQLLTAARAAGHTVRITSAFRPYAEQVRVFRTMKEKGRAARPGHSEHQLGTTIDLRLPTTRAIEWLAEHAAAHGFVLSYPPGKQRITGYRPEPWHVRFVGRELAARIPAGGTLEELFRHHPELAESGDCADCPAPVSRTKCGPVTTEGTCEGTVLTWCYDGARAAVDCAASNQTCGRAGATPDCVPAISVGAQPTGAAVR